jgi:hypothetical protein
VCLQTLDLSNNSFAGVLPVGWGSMQQLLLLNLSYNSLSGSLPTSWACMTSLQVLDISSNKLQVSYHTATTKVHAVCWHAVLSNW